jgi:hypothetical protein
MSKPTEQSMEAESTAFVRSCIHYRTHPPGAYYGGIEYVAALQKLKASAAMQAVNKVESFFWNDAPKVQVWLCHECAAALGL